MRPAIAEISLGALRHNLARAQDLAGNSEVTAVIKANGYGHGATRILPALKTAKSLAVASIGEALDLRAAGTGQAILLLEGIFEAGELKDCISHNLNIVVHDKAQLDMIERTEVNGQIEAWLKVDTGMGRLGFRPEDVPSAWTRLQNAQHVEPVGCMSHFASADDPSSRQTADQLALFKKSAEPFSKKRSIANSAGLIAHPESRMEIVRPGIMLFGVTPMVGRTGPEDGLEPVMTLKTRLIATKNVKAGESVGYGADWRASKDQRIGIAAIGYGDGYPRHAPTGTPVLVDGRRTRLLGRVSMDMIALDIEGIEQADVGTSVILWGRGLPIEEIASHAGTIAYELLCHVTSRVSFEVVD